MERFAKVFLAQEYKLSPSLFINPPYPPIQKGGNNEKIIKISYDKSIELDFKKITKDNDEIEIYLTNDIGDQTCISVQINKKLGVGTVHGISKETPGCFNHADFILKHPGSFYMEMILKLLKKYKDKFNINRLTLIDNAVINCDNNGKFNLSQYLLLVKGSTYYEKFGFKITDENKRKIVKDSKNIINQLKIKDIDFEKIFEDIKNNKKYNLINQKILLQIKQILKGTLDKNFMVIMNHIFYKNRTNDTCLLYSLIISNIIRQLETKYSKFTRLDQLEYYLDI
jgi:hypothetical protein